MIVSQEAHTLGERVWEDQGLGNGLREKASIALRPAEGSGSFGIQIDRIQGFGRNIAFVCKTQVNEVPCVPPCGLECY